MIESRASNFTMSGRLPVVLSAIKFTMNNGAGEGCVVGVSVGVTVMVGVDVGEAVMASFDVSVGNGGSASVMTATAEDVDMGVFVGVGSGGLGGELIKATAIVVMDPMTATQIATGIFHRILFLLLTLRPVDFSFAFRPVLLFSSLVAPFASLTITFPP
ncbi:MAG TPA: hypothetical protein VFO91_02710 [Anaerolineales bacterium]|nr:hypothetical protein [Anaerolineales bacterium]